MKSPRVWLGAALGVALLYALGTLIPIGEMTLAGWAGTWPTAAASGGAACALLYSARLRARADRKDEDSDRTGADGIDGTSALRLFGFAALAWCAGAITYGVTGLFSTAAFSLTFGDLFSLMALPLFVLGFTKFAPLPRGVRPMLRHFTDSYVCAAAVFAVVWLVLFQPLYQDVGEGSGFVVFALVYPVADIAVLCLLAPLVFTSPHRTRRAVILAMGAFTAICGADLIGTITRLAGEPVAGGIEYPVRLFGFLLLSGLPWLIRGDNAGSAPRRITGRGLYRFAPELAALTAMIIAVVVMTASGLRMSGVAPVLPLVAGSAVLVLLVRMLEMLEENATLSRMVHTRERHFHELARNSGDVILILEQDGRIFYVSPGTAEIFGYRLDDVLADSVTALIHPEDLPAVTAAVAEFERGVDSVHMRVRVRAADGTWRHTTSTASVYERPGEPDRFLLTTRDISAQVELQNQVNHLTFHDGVTGLPNRAYLEERTREVLARRAGTEEGQSTVETAAIFLDLDGFTAVNDSAGHTFGDYLLAQVGHRLRATLSAGDTLARWGSDEFAVLIEERPRADSVVDLAERMIRVIGSEPFQVAEREVVVTASVGVAFADPEVDGAELLRNADMAMARAKGEGGGHLEVYAADMHAQVVHRLELQSELRQALADNAFMLEYQPVVNLETSLVTAVEALVRWRKGDVLVPPDEFIGPAEESGLIVPLGEWILREACQKVAVWRGATGLDIGLSVNVSVKQVLSPRFVQTVAGVLVESGLNAEALTMEVDEEILLENPGKAVERLAELRDLGVRLAIDDFGMGHASLAHLRRLRADELKIDPSFIRDLGEDGTVTLLTQAIIRLGQDLGMQVTAEGIEHPRQLERLREMGCTFGQGFLVARPMPADGVEALVGSETSATVL